jgi:hypothetical protein
MILGTVSLEIKRLEGEADHLSSSRPPVGLHDVYRGNFTVCFNLLKDAV